MGTVGRGKPVVVHEDECEFEGWTDPALGGLQWRTLFSAGRTESDSITCGVVDVAGRVAEDVFSVHQHAQSEVYYVLSGEGMVTIDGVEYPVRAGSAVFIPSNALHGSWSTGTGPMRLFYVFAADSFEEVVYVFPGLGGQ